MLNGSIRGREDPSRGGLHVLLDDPLDIKVNKRATRAVDERRVRNPLIGSRYGSWNVTRSPWSFLLARKNRHNAHGNLDPQFPTVNPVKLAVLALFILAFAVSELRRHPASTGRSQHSS